jgi:hypothetical protein
MSRQERLDCSALIAGVLALLLIGWQLMQPTPTSPAASAPAAAQQVMPAALTIKPTAVVTVAGARAWAEATLTGSGVQLPTNVTLLFSDVANCGADLSAAGKGGCTYQAPSGPVIVLSPDLAWTEAGSHILFHEVAHALGIGDECAAEEWAHQFEDAPYWSYPTCNAY